MIKQKFEKVLLAEEISGLRSDGVHIDVVAVYYDVPNPDIVMVKAAAYADDGSGSVFSANGTSVEVLQAALLKNYDFKNAKEYSNLL